MSLEAVMVCLDNSEWTRNGDFAPTRWENQQDAANMVCEAKTQQNPETTIGLMSSAGKRVEVVLTQTNDIGRLLAVVQEIKINGENDLPTALQIAQLSLKHRQNKNQRQRIIAFVGSPVDQGRDFVQLGKRMKKNNVAIDIVNFGHPENLPKLQALVDNANNNDNSHLLDVPAGITAITDILIASPILSAMDMMQPMGGGAEGGAAAVGAGAGHLAEFGGIDPNLDPELAFAMRISMEEEKARLE